MDEKLLNLINAATAAGGMGLLILAGMKWFVGDYFKTKAENDKRKDDAIQVQINSLRDVAGDIKLEMKELQKRFYQSEGSIIDTVSKLNHQSEKFQALTEAMRGFVKTCAERMTSIENKADKALIAIGTITRNKKTSNE